MKNADQTKWELRIILGYKEDGSTIYTSLFTNGYPNIEIRKANEAIENTIDSIRYEKIIEMWLKNHRMSVKDQTIQKYENIIRLYIMPNLGHYDIQMIDAHLINEFIQDLKRDKQSGGYQLSLSTIKSTISVIKSTINYAEILGYHINLRGKILYPKNYSNTKTKTLSKEERVVLESYLVDNLSPIHLGILLCLYCGFRIGEICALKWKDIDLSKNVININYTMQRIKCDETFRKTKIVLCKPKSQHSCRQVPIPHDIISFLKYQYVNNDNAYLLTGNENYFIEPRSLNKKYTKILKRCKISHINFHALRHTFATRCIEIGMDVKTLSEILGHASVEITLNKYVHPSINRKQEQMQLLKMDKRNS